MKLLYMKMILAICDKTYGLVKYSPAWRPGRESVTQRPADSPARGSLAQTLLA
ncbi:hypothetical protein DPMN_102500 [Dreissena polymorpha]|uniref:Uncharacterized protein n=1 Tax=Dreissena polymorpha TaxID=45954 RepID=A0A9D4RAX6_DREPO|nr:hypothetical protein DPMN_102500 [Dreissena polymorpha]